MAKHTLIIGRRSNLSCALASKIQNATLVSSDELAVLPKCLVESGKCDLIYNVYHKSTLLHQADVPEIYAKYAFTTLANFVSLCLEHRRHIDSVIFSSSSAVYGNNANASEADKTDITNLYASLKLASEFFLRDHLRNTSIRLVIPRVFNMYGGNDEFSVVSKIAAAIVNNREISVTNRGRSVRDYIHIGDVVAIYLKLLQSSFEGVINVGNGEGISLGQLIDIAQSAYGRSLGILHINRDEIERSVACTELLMRSIGSYTFKKVDSYYHDCAQQQNARKTP